MLEFEQRYKNILLEAMSSGVNRADRTGVGSKSIFNQQLSWDLSTGEFPMITGRKMFEKTFKTEFEWFMNGETNIRRFQDAGVKIWDAWQKPINYWPPVDRKLVEVKIRGTGEYYEYSGDFSSRGLDAKKGSFENRLRNIWTRMMTRCYKESTQYYWYKKVSVHPDWHDCSVFVKEVQQLPGFSLENYDKIQLDKDYYGSKVYSKETCVWLYKQENTLYTKNFKPFKVEGEVCLSFNDAEDKVGIKRSTLHRWIKQGKIDVDYLKAKEGYVLRLELKNGDLGPVYGYQMLNFNNQSINQLEAVKHSLKHTRDSRRHIISLWNPAQTHLMALPPCYLYFQFFVDEGERLNMFVVQRSGDLFLGIPYDVALFSQILLYMCEECKYLPGQIDLQIVDAHVYSNQIEAINAYRHSETFDLPTYTYKDKTLKIKNYQHGPVISAPVAV